MKYMETYEAVMFITRSNSVVKRYRDGEITIGQRDAKIASLCRTLVNNACHSRESAESAKRALLQQWSDAVVSSREYMAYVAELDERVLENNLKWVYSAR